jgi:hypothetical protein
VRNSAQKQRSAPKRGEVSSKVASKAAKGTYNSEEESLIHVPWCPQLPESRPQQQSWRNRPASVSADRGRKAEESRGSASAMRGGEERRTRPNTRSLPSESKARERAKLEGCNDEKREEGRLEERMLSRQSRCAATGSGSTELLRCLPQAKNQGNGVALPLPFFLDGFSHLQLTP